MYIFNKKRYKNKITFYEEEKKVGLTYRWLLQKVIRRFMESDPEKNFLCAWLGLTKFKINLIKFT